MWSLASVALVSLISLVGLVTLAVRKEVMSKLLLIFVSFSAGGLLGDAFLHLLPEAVEGAGFTVSLSLNLMLGIGIAFTTEKFICWIHCHIPTSSEHEHKLGWMNLFGDGVHNFIDGLAIGGSYLVSIPIGVTTTMAVLFHEIPQEIGDFGVLVYSGFSSTKAIYYNFLTALTAVVGTLTSMMLALSPNLLMEFLMPFTAGTFIYIACADLIPELHKTSSVTMGDSTLQLAAQCSGVAVMLLLKAVLE